MRDFGVGAKTKSAYPFMGVRCDRVVLDVFARLAELIPTIHRYGHAS